MSKVAPDTNQGYKKMDPMEIVQLINDMIQGYQTGQVLGGAFNTPHAEDFKKALKLIENIDFKTGLSTLDENRIYQAIMYLDMVDSDDNKYVQCYAWYYQSILYAVIHEYVRSRQCLDKLSNMPTNIFTKKKEAIKNLQEKESLELLKIIDESEAAWAETQRELQATNTNHVAEIDAVFSEITRKLNRQRTLIVVGVITMLLLLVSQVVILVKLYI